MMNKAAEVIKIASRVTAFTGAGISVESGIPPFRGENGLWSRYDPGFLAIERFRSDPLSSWELIKEIFYDFFGKAEANGAHRGIAEMERSGHVKAVITQNIDNLHQSAGSREVYEFHGNSRELLCEKCGRIHLAKDIGLVELPPHCDVCGGVLRPNFVFFGEPIPEPARSRSFREAETAEVLLVIGTTGEIMPASLIPILSKKNGATIVEVNIEPSNYTNNITDIFLQGRATEVIAGLVDALDIDQEATNKNSFHR